MSLLGTIWRLIFPFVATTTSKFSLNQTIDVVYHGIMDSNAATTPFLIHRPHSETPGDAVSEGVGYGLLLALYCNDQDGFDKILDGAEKTMWNGQFYNWRVGANGVVSGYGAAVDAEQDIAFACIMANRLVKTGDWRENSFYESRARVMVSNLWSQGLDDGVVRAGYGWGGRQFVNVGYFAPAWYRVFATFDTDPSHNWTRVVETCYDILERSPGYEKGLVPDWMTPDGGFTDNLGYNAYGGGRYMYKDAIRTLWRVGTDALWNGEERAYQYIIRAYEFLPDIRNANFFQMDGALVPETDTWEFDGGRRTRPRREHSPLTIGMWSIPIALLGSEEEIESCHEEFGRYYESGANYWGLNSGGEDIEHSEMYFEQFLAEFGALFLTGRWKLL